MPRKPVIRWADQAWKRSFDLLWEYLDRKQRAEVAKSHRLSESCSWVFRVQGYSGGSYTIRFEHDTFTELSGARFLCIGTLLPFPSPDTALALKLMLETDEGERLVCNVANSQWTTMDL